MSNTERPPGDPTTPASPTAHDIERFMAWRLVRTGREVERALTDTIAQHDLTTTQFGVLSLLATGAEFTQSDLARAVLVRPQSVGPLITSLTERGLITRRGPGGRGRRTYVDLTPTGQHLIERAWPQVTSRHSPAQLGLDEDDARALDRLLRVCSAPRDPHGATTAPDTSPDDGDRVRPDLPGRGRRAPR